MKALACPLCRDTGRIRLFDYEQNYRTQVMPCPACPPSETVNEALDYAAARRAERETP